MDCYVSRTAAIIALAAIAAGTPASLATAQAPAPAVAGRPMTWLDVQNMRQVGSPAPSPDGKWLLYTLSTPDWKEARRQNDVYVVSTTQGTASARRLTFTNDKNETAPGWSRDGKFFVFLSDRDAARDASANRGSSLPTSGPGAPYFPPAVGGGMGGASYQLYLMRPDGGEARKITEAKDGVTTYAFSKDGAWLVYRSGPVTQEQLYALPVATLAAGDSAKPVQLTRHPNGIGLWRLSPDSRRIYFVTADTTDPDERLRLEKRFDVRVRNADVPVSSLWALDLDTKRTTRLTRDTSYSVGEFDISPDGKWIGFRGINANRYDRNILEQNINADLYLLEVASGQIERLTKNTEIGESSVSFSPDSRTVAFSAPDDFVFMNNSKVYLRDVSMRGGTFRKLGGGFDGDVTVGFWKA
jgi:Tol biopolymer transport system component